MEMISIDQMEDIKDAIKEAREDDTPYLAFKDDELHVLGNPNKTEIKPANYVLKFAFPNTAEWRKNAENNGDTIGKTTQDGRYFLVEREYKNVFMSPRNIGNAITALAEIEKFIFSVQEDGELKELSYDEMRAVLSTLNHELSDACYEVVSAVLHIPFIEQEWMLPISVVENVVQIIANNPSLANETDLFFGLSPADGE